MQWNGKSILEEEGRRKGAFLIKRKNGGWHLGMIPGNRLRPGKKGSMGPSTQ